MHLSLINLIFLYDFIFLSKLQKYLTLVNYCEKNESTYWKVFRQHVNRMLFRKLNYKMIRTNLHIQNQQVVEENMNYFNYIVEIIKLNILNVNHLKNFIHLFLLPKYLGSYYFPG